MTARPLLIALALALAAPPVLAADRPQAVTDALDLAAEDCADFENGTLSGQEMAAYSIDLTGDGRGWVVDTGRLSCSSAASMFCGGTGGCPVTFVVGDSATEVLTKGWTLADFPPLRVILMQIHGSECGGTNLTPCVSAMVWDEGSQRFTVPDQN